mmetsp:Transcript_28495/g.42812  ORF Transcript_28495/g.42812 Transcript_28495/m.42812 type:complete len:162 (-) Transcript_28495:194-679(-)
MDLNLSAGLSKDELLKSRMDHVFNVWMQQQQHPYVQSVLVKENIKTWYDFQQFLNNPDEINAVKNRKGLEVFEEEYDGKLSYFWWKRFKHALSYVNELQIEKGPLNDGLVENTGSENMGSENMGREYGEKILVSNWKGNWGEKVLVRNWKGHWGERNDINQ